MKSKRVVMWVEFTVIGGTSGRSAPDHLPGNDRHIDSAFHRHHSHAVVTLYSSDLSQYMLQGNSRLSGEWAVASSVSPSDGPNPRLTVWDREIPFRNPHFTGRTRELEILYGRLVAGSAVVVDQSPQALYGLGGVGKTEIATEYAHRYRSYYDVVWWIRAEQPDAVVNSLVALGRMLKVQGFRPEERDLSARLVVEALQAGEPSGNWLLIYDNAKDTRAISDFIPKGPGHVVITSRDSHWRKALGIEGIEIAEFTPEEAVKFLCARVPTLEDDPDQTSELAKELGFLPLAAEHAAAFMMETGTSVREYLDRLRSNAHELLASEVDIHYPVAVATTWSVSREAISTEADRLFQLLAFFSPEPIAEELLVQSEDRADDFPPYLSGVLTDLSQFRRAVRQLARFSLVKIDAARNVIQIHRLVRAVTQGRLMREAPENAVEFRNVVHMLLANSNPRGPDREVNNSAYDMSRPHLVASGALRSPVPGVRRLIIDQVRRLHLRGGYRDSVTLGEEALREWREQFEENDKNTLDLAIELGVAMRRSGQWQAAFELNSDTLERLRGFGADDETYLTCARSHGVDLRMLGRYAEALENDRELLRRYERIYRPEHVAVPIVRNNIAITLRCLGRFEEALQLDREIYGHRNFHLGPSDDYTLTSQFAIARDLRLLGRYEESLDLIRKVNRVFEEKDAPWHVLRLLVASDFGIALRKAGHYQDAARQGEFVFQKQRTRFGDQHRQTLLRATNLINDRRLVDDFSGAAEVGEYALEGWMTLVGPDHPNTEITRTHLAVVLRMRGNPSRAIELNDRALERLREQFGEEHPSSLVVMHNLASDLVVAGELRRGYELSEQAYELSCRVRGVSHPCTLATGANLALDRRAVGDDAGARELRENIIVEYGRILPEHPEARMAVQRGRINLDIEPMMS